MHCFVLLIIIFLYYTFGFVCTTNGKQKQTFCSKGIGGMLVDT